MGKTKREEPKEEEPGSDSEDELCRRIMQMQCCESNHYVCDGCGATHTGNHDWWKFWDSTMGRESYYCASCANNYNENQKNWWMEVPTTYTCSSDNACAAAGPSEAATPCASDNACAAATPSEAGAPSEAATHIDAISIPVPDNESESDLEMEDGPGKNECEHETNTKDADKKP